MAKRFLALCLLLPAAVPWPGAAATEGLLGSARAHLVDRLTQTVSTDPLASADLLVEQARANPAFAPLEDGLLHHSRSIRRSRDLTKAMQAGDGPAAIARIAAGASRARAYDATTAGITKAFEVFDRAARDGDLSAIVAARQSLLETALSFAATQRPAAASVCAPIEQTPLYSIDLVGCDSVYTDDLALIIDVGGNDWYRNNAGGADAVQTLDRKPLAAAAVIDLGGNDRYGPDLSPAGLGGGTNGGSAGGAGFLLDLAGDDIYSAGGYGTNGGGDVGTGFLLDAGGDDTYTAGSYATNGAGMNGGVGLLIDLGEGTDSYTGWSAGVNGGGYLGHGNLIDQGGSDTYTVQYSSSWGSGANGGSTRGGTGFLFDGAGDDRYEAPYGGSNGGAYLGAGFLYDGGGADVYSVDYGYGANGGAHQGAGLLIDAGGDDRYSSGFSGINGGAEAPLGPAFGGLVDSNGNDVYSGTHFGVNGGAAGGLAAVAASAALVDGGGNDSFTAQSGGTNGGASGGYIGNVATTGLLLDVSGDDSYTATQGAVNGGTYGIPWLGAHAAALIDLSGRDHYSAEDAPDGYDQTIVPRGIGGAQIDVAGN